MQPSTDHLPSRAVPHRRTLGGGLVLLVSLDAAGVTTMFLAAALAAGAHPSTALGLLLVAAVGLAGVVLALIAIPTTVRRLSEPGRAGAATARAIVLIAIGLVVNTVGTTAILAAYRGSPDAVAGAAALLLVAGDALSLLYLALLRIAARSASGAH